MEQEQIITQVVNLELVEYQIADKLFLAKDSLFELAKHIHGKNNVFLVDGSTFFEGAQHERYNWITQELLSKVYSADNGIAYFNEKMKYPVYFSYVKFATIKDSNLVFGIQSGKSQFYSGYNSDISFWDINSNNENKYLGRFMWEHNLEWHKKEILIIKSNEIPEKEYNEELKKEYESKAYYNEKNIGWGLFS